MPVRELIAKILRNTAQRLSPVLNAPSAANGGIDDRAAERMVFEAASTARALRGLAARGHQIQTVIDVGASNGMWSDIARTVYPQAHYLLIEAQTLHEKALRDYCARHANTAYKIAAAGAKAEGSVYFEDGGPWGGAASESPTDQATLKIPVTSIDHEVLQRKLPAPYLIKLDTHGFEVPILQGAERTLKQAELVVIETYTFRLNDKALRWYEMCDFMRQRGFAPVDFSEPLWRSHDHAFWQMDLFFIPVASEEFQHNAYA